MSVTFEHWSIGDNNSFLYTENYDLAKWIMNTKHILPAVYFKSGVSYAWQFLITNLDINKILNEYLIYRGKQLQREITTLTDELGLRLTIGLRNIATFRTGPGGISGINKGDRNPCQFSLVTYKLSEFVKRPFTPLFSLLFPNRDPKSLEIFKSNASSGVFSSLNNFLRNGVISLFLKPSLFVLDEQKIRNAIRSGVREIAGIRIYEDFEISVRS